MARYNTGNQVPSSDMRDIWDDNQIQDSIINGAELEVPDRKGKKRKSWAGIEKDSADKLAQIDSVISSLDTASFTFPDIASGLAGTANGQYFRVVQGVSSTIAFIYYRNQSGTAVAVAYLPSSQAIINFETTYIQSYFVNNGYLNESGALVSDVNWGSTDFINVDRLRPVSLKLRGAPNVSSIAFYDQNYKLLSKFSAASAGAFVDGYPSVPAGAFYVRLTMDKRTPEQQAFLPVLVPDAISDTRENGRQMALEINCTRSGYLNLSGALVTDANWLSSELTDLKCWCVTNTLLYGNPQVGSVCFYDGNFVFLSAIKAAADGDIIGGPLAPPAGAAYVAFTIRKNTTLKQVLKCLPAMSAIPGSNVKKGVFDDDISGQAVNDGFITATGAVTADANWLYSDYIDAKEGDSFRLSVLGHTNVCAISFYNASRQFISGVRGASNNALFTGAAVAPSGTASVRISFGKPSSSVFPAGLKNSVFTLINLVSAALKTNGGQSKTAETIFRVRRKVQVTATSKVILYGDSISSTDYPWYRDAMQRLTGAQVYNGGFSGFTAAQLAATAQMQRIFNYAPDVIIVMVGGNDTGAPGTVGTFSGAVDGEPYVAETDISADYTGTYFIQAVSHTMRKLQASYYNIRARASLTGNETEAEKQAKIDAVLKPVIVFCTPLPQKRVSDTNAFSIKSSQERKRQAVIECCNRYRVGCIDLYRESAFDMSVEPYWTSPTDKVTNNGVYFMDGLHPNKYGFEIIAEVVCAELML